MYGTVQTEGGSDTGEKRAGFAGEFELGLTRLQEIVDQACAAGKDWPAGVAAAVRATLELAAREPQLAQTLTVKPFQNGLEGALLYRRMIERFGPRLARGRDDNPRGEDLPPLTEEAFLGGLAQTTARHVVDANTDALPALAAQLIELALRPYLGADEAGRSAEPALRT